MDSICGWSGCHRRAGKPCARCEAMSARLAEARIRRLIRLAREGNRFAGLAARRYLSKKEVH